MRAFAVLVVVAVAVAALLPSPKRAVRVLPPGVTELHSEMVVDTDLEGAFEGSTLRMMPDFQGRAAVVVLGKNIRLRDFDIEGNRQTNEVRTGLPPYDVPFARFTTGSGILVEGAQDVRIDHIHFREIAGFAVLVHAARRINITRMRVHDSGSRNEVGRNNTTGGILLEHGTTDFRVTDSEFWNIRGNGLWTHSLYTAPRNARGVFANNLFNTIGRDALQAGHAIDMRIEHNRVRAIGFPPEIVDAAPVGIDTAGNVERTAYRLNDISFINGKCIDLDGFHDGEVAWNKCEGVYGYGLVMNNTNPDMRSQNIKVVGNTFFETMYGGIFVIGTGHHITQNHLVGINSERCENCFYKPDEPDMLRSGIYLGKGAERPDPAHGNMIEDNQITGHKMAQRCVTSAPGITGNVIRNNVCRDLP